MRLASRLLLYEAPGKRRWAATGEPSMRDDAKHDLRDEIVDIAVVASILLVVTLFALVAVRFALS
jgi:hypothetical protein